MGYAWGESIHDAGRPNWSVPQPPPPPAEQGRSGWQWEGLGVAGTERTHSPYTMAETSDTLDYFSNPYYPASATQFHGPFPDGARSRMNCDPQCQVDWYGKR
jgi:hypothetical protein